MIIINTIKLNFKHQTHVVGLMLSDFQNEFGNGFAALEITFIVVYLTTPIAANYQYTSVEVGHQTLHGDSNFLSPASAFLVVY